MARSARSSGIKKNKAALKKRVFGPVETARNERLSAKLLELANAPKEKMEVEETKPEETKATEGTTEGTVSTGESGLHDMGPLELHPLPRGLVSLTFAICRCRHGSHTSPQQA
jgi:hypothetical protein